jgi:serine/threonine protein kinase
LAEAHALGLIHRDIKPANIILTNRGGMADFVKVLDFGLARAVEVEQDLRLTAANVISGTPQYMAPEAIDQPQSVDARTDLYAVGAVAYYLVTGKTVFDGNSVMEICMKQMKERPMLPSEALGRPISPWLEALILKCLGKTPRERPPSAVSLEAELAECKVDDTWTPADADKWWRRFKSEAGARPSQDSQAGQPTPQVGLETAPFGKAQ